MKSQDKHSSCYCVECLKDIGPAGEDHDGMCDGCREYLANGGEPVDLSITTMFGPTVYNKDRGNDTGN